MEVHVPQHGGDTRARVYSTVIQYLQQSSPCILYSLNPERSVSGEQFLIVGSM